jgi:hypothetical protein
MSEPAHVAANMGPGVNSGGPHTRLLADCLEGRTTVLDVYRQTARRELGEIADWRWWDPTGPDKATLDEIKSMSEAERDTYERARGRRTAAEGHNAEQLWKLQWLWAFAIRVEIDPGAEDRIVAKAESHRPGIVADWQERHDAHDAWRRAGRPPAEPTAALTTPQGHRYRRCVWCDWYGAREVDQSKPWTDKD